MSKPFYADYVRDHTRKNRPSLGDDGAIVCKGCSDAFKIACIDVLSGFCAKDKEILIGIYNASTGLVEAIEGMSVEQRMPRASLWALVNRYEKAYATKMGLIGGGNK